MQLYCLSLPLFHFRRLSFSEARALQNRKDRVWVGKSSKCALLVATVAAFAVRRFFYWNSMSIGQHSIYLSIESGSVLFFFISNGRTLLSVKLSRSQTLWKVENFQKDSALFIRIHIFSLCRRKAFRVFFLLWLPLLLLHVFEWMRMSKRKKDTLSLMDVKLSNQYIHNALCVASTRRQ